MAQNKTITINGRQYDAVTGLPVRGEQPKQEPKPKPVTKEPATPAPVKKPAATATTAKSRVAVGVKTVHSSTLQKSTTLRRRATKKPTPAKPVIKPATKGRTMDIAKSPKVTRFAPHPVVKTTTKPVASSATVNKKATVIKDKAPQPHYVAQKTLKKIEQKKAVAAKTALLKATTPKETKNIAINKALNQTKKKTPKKRRLSPWKKGALIGALVILAIVGAGYTVYRFVPSVSVSWAATRAGVNATYPQYIPDGFSLSQPVTYSDNEVLLTFKSNSNDANYSIRQTKSSWDSTAVLGSIVRPEAGENYVTTQERGLTIYSYDNSASWVNGGVLYTIEGNSQLSNEQIRHIATSL